MPLLNPLRHPIEGPGEQPDLVAPLEAGAGAEVPSLDGAGGPGQGVDGCGEAAGHERGGYTHNHQGQQAQGQPLPERVVDGCEHLGFVLLDDDAQAQLGRYQHMPIGGQHGHAPVVQVGDQALPATRREHSDPGLDPIHQRLGGAPVRQRVAQRREESPVLIDEQGLAAFARTRECAAGQGDRLGPDQEQGDGAHRGLVPVRVALEDLMGEPEIVASVHPAAIDIDDLQVARGSGELEQGVAGQTDADGPLAAGGDDVACPCVQESDCRVNATGGVAQGGELACLGDIAGQAPICGPEVGVD